MRFDTVIRNGTVVTAADTCVADIGIIGDKISAVGAGLPIENAGRVLDAANHLVIPGGIDVHTHLDMPFGGTTSADDFETGTIAAAFGGTTTLIDFAIQYKGQTLRQAFDTWMKKAQPKAVTDYAFHCIITDLGSAQLEEMGQLVREGVTSFKLFMASRWRKWPERLSTSCISPVTKRSKRFVRRVTAACRPTRRPARNIYIFRWKIWTRPASKARNTCSHRRSAKNGTKKNSGKGLPKTRCKSFPPTIARSASRNKRS